MSFYAYFCNMKFKKKRVLKPNKLEKQDLVEIRDRRKRDGKREVFSIEKIKSAISKVKGIDGKLKEFEETLKG